MRWAVHGRDGWWISDVGNGRVAWTLTKSQRMRFMTKQAALHAMTTPGVVFKEAKLVRVQPSFEQRTLDFIDNTVLSHQAKLMRIRQVLVNRLQRQK